MNDHTNEQPTSDNNDHEGRLTAENAKRRIAAKEAQARADAAEAEAESLRQQIAELRLSQARQQVTANHPELTAELIEKYAPEGVDADGLADWAEKSLGLVVALRGEPEPDSGAMSDAERELAAARLDLAIQQAVTEHAHVTVDVLDALCGADTPEGVAEWAATFEQVASALAAKSAEPTQLQLIMQGVRANKVGGGKMKRPGSGMEGVAQKLVNR
ncbi:hypothetical protein BAAM0483_02900 [Bifidobacterium animalis subsp. animalis MCC 0483]|uniref:Scaffolding protein n=1 Tax=Bifidobacterium animalis subsp. animalis MCC 0483 TaxID=1365955 RepID=A0AB34TAL9_9BIFI|nr:hypothetical protein [Bifidobacterium animalis]KOA51163.1 hypothetical protein BAAM0483_02900 [Bifidobacterium animalis subsp. animalis MCC 0483]